MEHWKTVKQGTPCFVLLPTYCITGAVMGWANCIYEWFEWHKHTS